MKKQSNTPHIRFQNYEDEWMYSTIGRHISLLNGRAYKQEELLDDGKYKVLRVGNFNTNSKWYYSNLELEDNKYVNKGELLYLWATNFGPEIWMEGKAIYHYHIWKLEFDKTNINQNYLYIWLESDKNKIQQNTNGSTMVHITKTMMEERRISLPSQDEQCAIGSLFRTLDDLLSSYKDNLTNYQSLKATMLSKMFPKAGQRVPEIRLDGFEGEWEIVKLGDNCRIITGGTPRTGVKEFWNPKEIPWMSSGEINKKILNETEEMISCIGLENSSAKWVKQNSVLIALAGQGQTRGRVAINKIPLTTNQSIAAIETNSNIDFLFLYTDLGRRYDELRLISSGDGTRGGLNKMIISRLELNIPSIEEQQAIGSYFSNLDNLINSHQEKISQLETLKKKLLQDMFI
ncbi:type I restriction modification DNA specificity domain protein [Streptococcus mitis SK579]|nr:type I restriction modification DNA specificity domain protein [Streptococcus mitis SK579]